jgi:hypothetical protein
LHGYWQKRHEYDISGFHLEDSCKFIREKSGRKVIPATKSNDKSIITILNTVIKFFEAK